MSTAIPLAAAAPTVAKSYQSGFWLGDIDHSKDTVWKNDGSYKVFRNVKDYGAVGDGSTDDTRAIMAAMTEGERCGGAATGSPGGCDSSTVHPAIIYFPSGDYVISSPIKMYYYTQVIGDAVNMPTIKPTADFEGMALLDADPYDDSGANWFTNQNNFFRQVRNFIIDVRPWAGGKYGAGIHWQVSQATSLQNIVFKMSTDPDTQQQGIFMDNGSGGFFSDLTFEGGKYGAFLGSQQYTIRNLTFTDCQTAIFMNWNWGWTIHGITVHGGDTAIDMGNVPENKTVGAIILADSTISSHNGVRYSYANDDSNTPPVGNTLFLENVDMRGAINAVVDYNDSPILAGGSIINAWAAGHGYDVRGKPQAVQNVLQPEKTEGQIKIGGRPASLLDDDGKIVTRSKPQYEGHPVSDFITAKSNGCVGDGKTDDTQALQNFLNLASRDGKIAYLEHGAYLVRDTIRVPKKVRIVGEIWPYIMADGSSPNFMDDKKPKAVFQIGQPGDKDGAVEVQDIMFQTKGAAPGAVMIEWNLQSAKGASAMWDTHVRIGGSAGTMLEGPEGLGGCRNSTAPFTDAGNCKGVFLMFHATKSSANVYLENTWFWVADHDLDNEQPLQVDIYSARGALFESLSGAAWLWGTASEHSVIYNYQVVGVAAFFGGLMQTETPYFQPNPEAPRLFHYNAEYNDPEVGSCGLTAPAYPESASASFSPTDYLTVNTVADPIAYSPVDANAQSSCLTSAWGLRVAHSRDVIIYGIGMYSFFKNYEQSCVSGNNCQKEMVRIDDSDVRMYMASTKSAVRMIAADGRGSVLDADNRSNFCGTVGFFLTDRSA